MHVFVSACVRACVRVLAITRECLHEREREGEGGVSKRESNREQQ